MQGRIYAVPMAFTAQSAAFDAFELIAPATGIVALVGLKLGQTTILTDANEIICQVVIKRATGAYTSGSAGAAVTPVPMNFGDVAASFTGETRNTTQAVAGSGALTIVDNDAWNVRSPFLWLPPERMYLAAHPTDAIVISLTDPGTSVSVGGTAYVEELGT